MTIVNLFIQFAEIILQVKILNVELIDYMITFAIIITIFKLIGITGGIKIKRNKKNKGSE